MKFNVGRIAFNNVMNLVSLGLPSKDYGDATSGILFSIEKESPKKVTAITNSLETFIKTEFEITEKGEPGISVPNGKILANITSGLQHLKNPISFASDDSELEIACGKSYKGSVAHYDSASFYMPMSNDEIQKLASMSVPIRYIKKAIDEVAFACSKDKTHIELTGIFFNQTKDSIDIVGSDSLRMSIIHDNIKVSNPQAIVISIANLNLLKKVIGMLEIKESESIKFYISEKKDMVYVIFGTTTIGFQTYGDAYFDGYKEFLVKEDDCATTITVAREELINLLHLATYHNNSAQDAIRFAIPSKKEGMLESLAKNASSNTNNFSIPFEVKGHKAKKAVKVAVPINPQYLLDVLTKISEKEVKIGLIDNQNGPVAVFPVSDSNKRDYVHIFSLVE